MNGMWSGIVVAIFVGSLFSVCLVRCIYRLPNDQKLWSPPLQCKSCHNPFLWIAHIPLLGIFFLKRRCPSCQAPIPLQAFWIEVCTILGTIGVVLWRHEIAQLVIDLIFLYVMIVISFIDWNEMIIEPRVIVLAIATRLIWLAWFESHAILYYLGSLFIAAGAFYFISFVYETLRRRQGLGDGDAAVIGVIALWIGWEALSVTILIAALSGLVITGTLLVLKKRPLKTTQVPFAPFLCLAGGTVYYLQNGRMDFSFIF